MEIETWFPLAVGIRDLRAPPGVTSAMRAALAPWCEAAAAQRRLGMAWTGDANGCQDLHAQGAFAWLREEVERGALAYLEALGCDLARVWPEFQASWPVVSSPGEVVTSHTHHSASLSVVYYLCVPPGSGGELVFENVCQPNRLGLGPERVDSPLAASLGPLNAREARYAPREQRLLLFAARQPHRVLAHQGPGVRISLTFDVGLAARTERDRLELGAPRSERDSFQQGAVPRERPAPDPRQAPPGPAGYAWGP